MKICVAGALGRMGRRILEMAAASDDIEVGAGFDRADAAGLETSFGSESGNLQRITLTSGVEAAAGWDVLIDFTQPEVCLGNVRAACAAGKPSIIGTTGLSAPDQDELRELSESVPIVFAPNMSVGVNVLFKIVGEVAARLGLDYNVEITDIHHNQKKDSPSGTAVRLAEIAADALGLDYGAHVRHGREGLLGARPVKEIGMHVLRGGDVVGEHSVAFIGHGERLELTHRAHNRDNFAQGALVAARFVAGAQPGLFDMQDVLGLK